VIYTRRRLNRRSGYTKDAKDHEGLDATSAVLVAFVSIVTFVPIVFNHDVNATAFRV
jgi:hypothetical protein